MQKFQFSMLNSEFSKYHLPKLPRIEVKCNAFEAFPVFSCAQIPSRGNYQLMEVDFYCSFYFLICQIPSRGIYQLMEVDFYCSFYFLICQIPSRGIYQLMEVDLHGKWQTLSPTPQPVETPLIDTIEIETAICLICI